MKISTKPALILALLAATPAAAQSDCSGAQEDYGRAVDQVQRRMEIYARCVSASNGRNDCALEFKQLEKAQKAFDESVMQIGFRCRPDRQSKFGDPN